MRFNSLPTANDILGRKEHMLKAELPRVVNFAGNVIAFVIPVQFVNDDVPIVTGMVPVVNAIPLMPEQLLNALSPIDDREAGKVIVPVMRLQYLKA